MAYTTVLFYSAPVPGTDLVAILSDDFRIVAIKEPGVKPRYVFRLRRAVTMGEWVQVIETVTRKTSNLAVVMEYMFKEYELEEDLSLQLKELLVLPPSVNE